MRITRGLLSSSKKFEVVALGDVAKFIGVKTDCYELIGDTNRVFFDFDGKDIRLPPDDFTRLDGDVRNRIIEVCERIVGNDYALMTASSHAHDIVSYRVVFPLRKCSREHNRLLATTFNGELEGLHPNIKADEGVYGNGRKMRMLGQSKDGENRPLTLLHGEPADTYLTEFLDSCDPMDETPPAKAKKEKKEKVKAERKKKLDAKERDKILLLLDKITPERIDDHESWIKLGIFLFNNGFECEVWDELSKTGDKYEEGACAARWATFHEGDLQSAGLLLHYIQQDSPELFERTYPLMKVAHEQTCFRLLNPSCYVVLDDKGGFQQLARIPMLDYDKKKTLEGERFIQLWIDDETQRTMKRLNFYPKRSLCPPDEYNLFKGFAVENIVKTDDCDVEIVLDRMRCLVNENQEHYEWLLKFVAHMFQFPENKPGVGVVFNGMQGTGKDSFWKFVGDIIGNEMFMNTSDIDRDLFGGFNGNASRKLLIKMEESSVSTMMKNKEKIKSAVTSPIGTYNQKYAKPVEMNSYERYVCTSNDDVPVLIEDTDRRFVLFTPSGRFQNIHCPEYDNPQFQRAFYDYLLTLDLTDYNPRNRPITQTYEEVKTASAPYHAKWFQTFMLRNPGVESYSTRPMDLLDAMNEKSKFETSLIKFGLTMKLYSEAGVMKKHLSQGTARYTFDFAKMKTYLQSKCWWVAGLDDDTEPPTDA